MEAVEIIRMLTTVSTPPSLARSVGVHTLNGHFQSGKYKKMWQKADIDDKLKLDSGIFCCCAHSWICWSRFLQPMPAEMHQTDELIQGSHFRTVGRHGQNPCSDGSFAQANGRREDATAPED